jgi:hypothetical protein
MITLGAEKLYERWKLSPFHMSGLTKAVRVVTYAFFTVIFDHDRLDVLNDQPLIISLILVK